MTDPVSLEPLVPEQRPVIERLWQLYAHDLSEFRGSMPDEQGLYRLGRLPAYLGDPDRAGYLVRVGPDLAGFVLVRGLEREPRVVGEFFIVRAARRQHVGHRAALHLLERHAGKWEIPFQEVNQGAARFWRRVATDAVGTEWREELRPLPEKPHLTPDTWLMLAT